MFQVGLPRDENFVIAASVLFEYETFPPCNNPVSIEFQLLVVLFNVALATCCNAPVAEIFSEIASNLLSGLIFSNNSPLTPTAVILPSLLRIAELICVDLTPYLIIGKNVPVLLALK